MSRVDRSYGGPDLLAQARAALQEEARAAGLTPADVEAELAAYNAERRDG